MPRARRFLPRRDNDTTTTQPGASCLIHRCRCTHSGVTLPRTGNFSASSLLWPLVVRKGSGIPGWMPPPFWRPFPLVPQQFCPDTMTVLPIPPLVQLRLFNSPPSSSTRRGCARGAWIGLLPVRPVDRTHLRAASRSTCLFI